MVRNNVTPTLQTKYSDDEKNRIIASLEKYGIAGAADLVIDAEGLVFGMALAIFDDENSTSKARRQYFKKLLNQSRKLKNTLNEIDYVTLQSLLIQGVQVSNEQEKHDDDLIIVQLFSRIIWMIGLLGDSTDRALKEEEEFLQEQKNYGRPEKAGALEALIRMLEEDWILHGYEPGYNVHKETEELSGPFCSFVDAAVAPVLSDRISKTSLQHRIRDALKSNYDRPGSFLVEVLGNKYLVSAWRPEDEE